MAATRYQPESRRPAGSPRPRGRENAKDTLCRNVLIYGHCRYEDQGCAFNHTPNKTQPAQPDAKTTRLNVDSPAFTPTALPVTVPTRGAAITPQAAAAAHLSPFTPRQASGTVTPTSQVQVDHTPLNIAQIKEFTPSYDSSQTVAANGIIPDNQSQFDAFQIDPLTMPTTGQYNLYLPDSNNMANTSGSYYPPQPTYTVPQQPLQYHLYAPIGPHREDLTPYERLAHDFFMPEKLREELHKKSEATLQVMPNSQLPSVEHFHTLVALDTTNTSSATVFDYPSWVYKATSSKNGKTYCLRRLIGYKLPNSSASPLQAAKEWKAIHNASVVSLRDVFTTRAFGDNSLIFVNDYFPLSKTLVEEHFTSTNRYGNRNHINIPEPVLWSYIVQISSAMKTIHAANLAVRCMNPSKIILTEKNRIRLNACAILDVVKHDETKLYTPSDLQLKDFILFGKLILALGTKTEFKRFSPDQDTNDASHDLAIQSAALGQLSQKYSGELVEAVTWLLTPGPPHEKNIGLFLKGIASQIVATLDSELHAADTRTSELSRELENGRLFRLMAKLGTITERPEYAGDAAWRETGEMQIIKLFRDYVFHQVDEEGKPVIDLAHIIRCLNNLDAGTDEKVRLISRNGDQVFIVTYKELKKQVASAWSDLQPRQKGRY